MIIWGSMGKMAVVGEGPVQHCPTCEKDRTFLTYLTYKVHHIWYLIRWISGKQYTHACEVCGRGVPLMPHEVESQLPKSPYSWFDRYSWTIVVGLVAVMVVAGVLGDRANKAENAELIAAPHVGDLYTLDLAIGATNPERPHMYTLGRIKSLEGDGVTMELAANYFDKVRGVQDDINNHSYDRTGYFAPDTGHISLANLGKMQRDGVVIEIDRQ